MMKQQENYMKDCIHIKACRRLCKIANIKNRGCNDRCTAYVSGNIGWFKYTPYDWALMGDYGDFLGEIVDWLQSKRSEK